MAAAFAFVAVMNFSHAGRTWPWLGGLSCFLLVAAWLRPALLKPLNRLWFRFGLLLHAVVNPVVMALLFYGAVWPTGVIMRALGKDLLRLRRERSIDSYWIVRNPPGPRPETMRDQF